MILKRMNILKIFIFLFLINPILVYSKQPFSASRLDKLSGEQKKTYDTKSDWDLKYSRPTFIYGKAPAKFLAENYKYLPENGKVLDMGMGEGRNAVFLAQKGHKVTGIDISSVAIKKAYHLAREYGVKIKGVVASLEKYKIPDHSFDSIICFYYVDRSLIKKMQRWLKPGGVIIFEAYTISEREKKNNRKDPISFYLKKQELLTLFKDMVITKYEEPLHEKKFRASIILKKVE